MAMKKHISSSGNTANAKELCHRAEEALHGIVGPLLSLREIGEHLKDCPFNGWTMRECIESLIFRVEERADLMPTSTDPKVAKLVRALLTQAQRALDALDEGATLLDSDYDRGVKHGVGAAAIGAGIQSLAIKAGAAFESVAALLMGAKEPMFYFKGLEKALEAT